MSISIDPAITTSYINRTAKYGSESQRVSNNNQFKLPTEEEQEDKKKLTDSNFSLMAPNAPENILEAWKKAENETGVNGRGKDKDGKLTHISAMFTLQLEQTRRTGQADLLGTTKESATLATQRALEKLDNSFVPPGSFDVIALQNKERNFYQAFLRNLDLLG